VNFLTTQLLDSLNLSESAQVILAAHHYHVLGTHSLSMSSNAILDLTDNDMVLDSDTGTTQVHLDYITGLLERVMHFEDDPAILPGWQGSLIPVTYRTTNGCSSLSI
jgi:hypothetical protein